MNQKWVTFVIGKEVYAFELEHVQEMTRLPNYRFVPQMPGDQLGVTMLRNKIVPVYDLAATLGSSGSEQTAVELAQTLSERKQDHINWLNELDASIREAREFKLTLDPTQCKFGVWYATFHTDDPWLSTLLRRMDGPHREIHNLGHLATACVTAGGGSKCYDIIEQHRKTTLRDLVSLFDQAIQQVSESTRRILIILRGRSGPLGVAVDGLRSVASIEEAEIQSPDNVPGHEAFEGLIGFWFNKQAKETVRLLDPVMLYPQMTSCPAHRETNAI